MRGQVWRESAAVGATDAPLFEATTVEEGEITGKRCVSNVNTTNHVSQLLETFQGEVFSDSDEGGGIQI